MGLVSTLIIYQRGKRRGLANAIRHSDQHGRRKRNSECDNYAGFCETYGSCDGQVCSYDNHGAE